MIKKLIYKIFLALFSLMAIPTAAYCQFNSGSTGADGALDLSAMECPANRCEIQLPESGILNYTTVNIPSNKVLKFKKNSRNTPVIILAQGNVVISGVVDVNQPRIEDANASFAAPGPGGFYGGAPNRNGFGPGAGIYDPNNFSLSAAKWVGPISLVPIVGGSGGASGGCGGGGAVVVASSTSVILSGIIQANSVVLQGFCVPNSGSGGAVRVIANTINVSGSLYAIGINLGVIRLEATNLSFTGSAYPAAVLSPINPTIVPSSVPQLTIASVGGYAVPSYAGSRFDTVDLLLPNQLPDPVNVVIQAANIPSGTEVQVGFVSGSPSGTSTSCTLTGGPGPLSCVATISNLNRSGVTYLLATAVFAPPSSLARFNPKGETQVAKVKLESALGAKSRYIFLDRKNQAIDKAKISKEFLQFFEM